MLTVHTVRLGGHGYYVDDLVPGRAEGSLLAGERPGVWAGAGAVDLGLVGEVDGPSFAAVLAGRDPRSGAELGPTQARARVRVAAYDLTFAAPKSVSLLQALAPGEVAEEAGRGHAAAVEAATGYLSRRAVGVRRSAGGEVRLLPSTGMAAGAFLHRTSRALDPHLHTHVVVANVARGVDGAWSAVDGRRLFSHVRTAGQLYRSHLRRELTDRLGAGWEVTERGMGDVVGVDPALRHLFSVRRAGIAEHLGRRPGRSSRSVAFFATRPSKDRAATVEALRPEWRRRAADFGHDLGALGAVVGRGLGPDRVEPFDPRRLADALTATGRPGRTLSRRDVEGLVAGAHVGGARVDHVEAMADRLLASPTLGEPVGGPPGRTVGTEPRWPVDGLLAAVVERGAGLADPGHGIGRRSGEHRDLVGRGAERVVDRGLHRAPDRGLHRAPDRGAGRER